MKISTFSTFKKEYIVSAETIRENMVGWFLNVIYVTWF